MRLSSERLALESENNRLKDQVHNLFPLSFHAPPPIAPAHQQVAACPFIRSFAHRDHIFWLQIMSHTTSSSSNAEERVQQLLQLQLAQRQEVATVSSALQAANIRVQTLETQLRTAQVHPPPFPLTRYASVTGSNTSILIVVRRACRPCRTRRSRASKTCSNCAMNSSPPSGARTTPSSCY